MVSNVSDTWIVTAVVVHKNKQLLQCTVKCTTFKALYKFTCLLPRLLNSEGGLLAYTGYDNKDARVTAAIANNIWSAFDRNARTAFDSDQLQMVVLECEVRIGKFPFNELSKH